MRIHVPPKDGWPEVVRGVGSVVVCTKCGAKFRGRTHAAAKAAFIAHPRENCG